MVSGTSIASSASLLRPRRRTLGGTGLLVLPGADLAHVGPGRHLVHVARTPLVIGLSTGEAKSARNSHLGLPLAEGLSVPA